MRSSELALAVALVVAPGVARSEPAPAAHDAVSPSPAAEAAPTWSCGDPIPAGYKRVARERRERIALAVIVFAAPYAVSAYVATDSYVDPTATQPPRAKLWIPGVGPFLELGRGTAAVRALLVADGVVQLGGLALLGYALATPEFVLVRQRGAALTVTPLVGRATGAAIVGRF